MSLNARHFVLRLIAANLCCLVFTSVTFAEDDKAVKLRFQFQKGEKLYYDVSHKMTMLTKFSRGESTDKNSVDEKKHFKVIAVNPDGSAELQTVFDHVRMSATFGQNEPVVFDSSMNEDKIPLQFRTVNESIRKPQAIFKVNDLGRLLAITPVDDAGKPDPAAATKEQKRADAIQNILFPLPEEPVAPGAAWKEMLKVEVTVNKTINREIKLLRTYRLDSIDNGVAKITFATSISSPVSNPQVRGQLIQRTPGGSIEFRIADGKMLSRVAKTDQAVVNALGTNTMMRAASERTENYRVQSVATAVLDEADE